MGRQAPGWSDWIKDMIPMSIHFVLSIMANNCYELLCNNNNLLYWPTKHIPVQNKSLSPPQCELCVNGQFPSFIGDPISPVQLQKINE